jgi:hypothetical protein
MKIHPVRAGLFHADRLRPTDGGTDGRTDQDRQTWQSYTRFSQFCERAQKGA